MEPRENQIAREWLMQIFMNQSLVEILVPSLGDLLAKMSNEGYDAGLEAGEQAK